MATKEQIALEVTSTADTGGIEKASASVEKLGDSQEHVSSGFTKSQASVISLNSAVDLAAKGFGVAKEIVEQTLGRTLELADGIDKLSQNLGISAEEASKLSYMTNLVGIDQGTLETAMTGAIRRGIQPNIEGMKKLSAEYLAIDDPIKRSQYALQTFGKQGLAMVDILEKGGAGIDALAQEAEQYGVILDDKAIEATKQFNIELKQLESRADSAKTKIGMALVETANKTFDYYDTLGRELNAVSEEERKLRQDVVGNAFLWGADAEATKASAQALTDFLIKQKELTSAFDIEDFRIKNLSATRAQAHVELMDQIEFASEAQDNYYTELVDKSKKANEETLKATSDLTLGMKDLTKEFIFQQAVQKLSPEAALQVAKAMGMIKTDTLAALDSMKLVRDASDINKNGFIDAGVEAAIYAGKLNDIERATKALQGLKAEITVTTINKYIDEYNKAVNADTSKTRGGAVGDDIADTQRNRGLK